MSYTVDQLLHRFQVFSQGLATVTGRLDHGPCFPSLEAFLDRDQPRLLEYLEMAAEIAVRETENFFQVVEVGEVGLSQDSQDPQSVFLVDDVIERPGRMGHGRRAHTQRPTAVPAVVNVKMSASSG